MSRRNVLAAFLTATAVSLCAPVRAATESVLYYATAGGTANYGAETQISKTASNQRILVHQGTVNINEGASVVVGGDSASASNFVGVDKPTAGVMNINGGTVWCTTSGGGAGVLSVGNNDKSDGATSMLTLNSGILKVDTQLRSAVMFNDTAGATSSGTITINGGEAIVKQVAIGARAQKAGCGTSTLILQGGVLTTEEIYFRPYNGQMFSWRNGTVVAARANIFNVDAYADTKTRTMEIVNNVIASFDTAGYAQTIPAFTGTGRLRLAGGGAVTFEQSTLTYGLIFDGIALNLGALDAGATPLTTRNLEIVGPTTLNVTLPASPSGRYPLIACTSSLVGSLGHVTVSGGGAGVLVRSGNTLYLSFDSADADAALVYSAAAGGADTPAQPSYARLAFTDAAGAFTVGGDGLTLAHDIADQSVAAQTVVAPVTLSTANSSIYVAEGGRLTLSGGLAATTPVKEGRGTLVLDNATMPASITPKEGTLNLGGNTITGLAFGGRRYHGEEITLTNGTWRSSSSLGWQGSTITVADGFTIDTTANNKRIAVGYAGVDSDGSVMTKLIVDGGTVRTAGDKGNTCNFVGVDKWGTAILEVKRGTFHANGASASLRIGVNTRPYQTGVVRVRGGLFKIDNDLSLATVHNGTGGGTSKGVFELSGGVADVENFYVGAASSTTGRGEVNLTGGVLEVGMFKCLARCTQTVTADGATIRAKRDASASAPFLSADASEDAYPKSYAIGADGLTVDTAGYAVGCDIPWYGAGGLTVVGEGGSLTVGGARSFSGDVVVSNGVTIVLAGSQTFAGRVVLGGPDARIRFDTTSYQEDTLTLATGGFALPDGVDDVLDFVELVGDGYVASVNEAGDTITLATSANVAAYAWWTGKGDPADFSDTANWACTNSTGGVVENALPVKSSVVVLSGTTSFTVPAGTTPVWVSTQIGDGGAVTLGADCDWAKLPAVTIADGSYIDLNGHDLKISNLTAAEGYDGAYVTNSVAGTKPALWAENAFSEQDYIDTDNVTAYTDSLEVKSVNGETFTLANQGLAWMFDAGVYVTNGTTTVTGNSYPGRYGHAATISVGGNATLEFQGNTHAGYLDDSSVFISVTNNATLASSDYFTLGHHNSGTNLFKQDGGTVTIGADFNIGVGNTSTARHEMSSGTLTVSGSLVPGRGESSLPGHGVFTQRGGTVNANGHLTIGYTVAGTQGAYMMGNGTLAVPNQRVTIGQGDSCEGLLEISGGTATAAQGINVATGAGSIGTLRVCGNGQLTASGIAANGGAATVEFDGGTVAASDDNAAFFSGLTNIALKAGGVALDTQGHDLGIANCTFNVAPDGKMTVSGGGTVTFTGTTLNLSEPSVGGAFVFAETDGVFDGAPAFSQKGWKLSVSDDRKTISLVRCGLIISIH